MMTRTPFAGVLAGLVLLSFAPETARAQGCVAVDPMGCSMSSYYGTSTGTLPAGEWDVSSSYRYFRSFRHFRGDVEESHRVEEGTEVVNRVHANDLGLQYGVTDRLSLNLTVPFVRYDRSSLYEHYGNSETANPARARFNTGATGLGDMRLSGSWWLFDPVTAFTRNVALGLGVKAPTGKSDVTDTFHKLAADGSDSLATRAVDQSIQPGDGGWGFTLDVQGYRSLFSRTSLYFDAFYLFNPRETNDVGYSVSDQYAARLGFAHAVLPQHGLSASLGGRWEGVPAEDLIGGSDGRRRPGYAVSLEPGVSYQVHGWNMALSVPFALYRNRTQSVSDRERTAETGTWTQGDAAFADYLISFTISTRFGGHHDMMGMPPMGEE